MTAVTQAGAATIGPAVCPRALGAVATATARNLAAPDRWTRVRTVLSAWVSLDRVDRDAADPPVETRYVSELWPGMLGVRADTSMGIGHWWELPYGERAVIDAIVRYVQPDVSFEFGTFSGSTTALIAAASPSDATVHTIDVPPELIDEAYQELGVTAEMIGRRLDDAPEAGATIEFHRQLIEDFDFTPLLHATQFVFVDASHDYESVRRDSRRALEILAEDGVVVWDDYGVAAHPGVTRALDELSSEVALAHVATTRLAVHGRGRFTFGALEREPQGGRAVARTADPEISVEG
jgi:predicted O-methyltransferase YrrM